MCLESVKQAPSFQPINQTPSNQGLTVNNVMNIGNGKNSVSSSIFSPNQQQPGNLQPFGNQQASNPLGDAFAKAGNALTNLGNVLNGSQPNQNQPGQPQQNQQQRPPIGQCHKPEMNKQHHKKPHHGKMGKGEMKKFHKPEHKPQPQPQTQTQTQPQQPTTNKATTTVNNVINITG